MAARGRELVGGLAVPVLSLVVTAACTLALLGRLPDRLPTHWSLTGAPDQSGPAWEGTVVQAVTSVLAVVAVLVVLRTVRDLFARRLLLALAAGVPALVATVQLVLLVRAAARPAAAAQLRMGPAWILLAVAVAVAAAVAAGAVAVGPPAPARTSSPPDADLPRLPGPATADLVWEGQYRQPLGLLASTALVLLLVLAAVLTSSAGLLVVAVLVALVLFPVAVMLTAARVRVDRDGVVVTGALPRPRAVWPLVHVRGARVVQVSPIAEFGGWGYRVGRGGRRGLVLRAGTALELELGDRSRFVVTVRDAETGAATVNSLLDLVVAGR